MAIILATLWPPSLRNSQSRLLVPTLIQRKKIKPKLTVIISLKGLRNGQKYGKYDHFPKSVIVGENLSRRQLNKANNKE